MDSAEQDVDVDRVLVRAFVESRSEETFRRLYRRHTPNMLRLGQRLSWNGEGLAEDAVQEAWVRAARLLPRFEWRSSLGSWLGGIVVNVVRELRRAGGGGALNGVVPEDFDVAADKWLDPVETIAVAEAVRELPEGYRTVIALHDIAGFTHAEIASILGIDPGTSKSQLARARARLREHFNDHQEEAIRDTPE